MGTLVKLFATSFCFVILLENVLASIADDKCNEYINLARNKRDVHGFGKIDITPGEFPHMGALIYGEERWVGCAGSLISDQYVLTGASCTVNHYHGRATKVRFGDRNLKSAEDDENVQEIEIDSIVVHPEYRRPYLYNDIALLKLKNKVSFTKFVRPACLNTIENFNSSSVIATGWGQTSLLNDNSGVLLKVVLDVYTNEECRAQYTTSRKLNRGIIDSQMCVGGRTEPKGTCQGDGGGPYQILKDGYNGVYTIVGTVSFGKSCGLVNVAEVGTRVSSYIPWIENTVWK